MNTYREKRVATTKQEAIEIFSEFFYTFHPVEVQEELRNLMNTAFTHNGIISQTEKEDMLYFCTKVEELVEAAYLLKE